MRALQTLVVVTIVVGPTGCEDPGGFADAGSSDGGSTGTAGSGSGSDGSGSGSSQHGPRASAPPRLRRVAEGRAARARCAATARSTSSSSTIAEGSDDLDGPVRARRRVLGLRQLLGPRGRARAPRTPTASPTITSRVRSAVHAAVRCAPRHTIRCATGTWCSCPYCTGDVHTGNAVATYVDPLGRGARPRVPPRRPRQRPGGDRLDAGPVPARSRGCSSPAAAPAGPARSANYYFLRSRLAAEHGYLLDDSGPIFPHSTNYASRCTTRSAASWNIDSIARRWRPEFTDLGDDFGLSTRCSPTTFPDDRLATTFFRRDYNFSRYSYERFYQTSPPKDEVHQKWWEDTQLLVAQYDTRDNLDYFIPYWRDVNGSHCTTSSPGRHRDPGGRDVDVGDYMSCCSTTRTAALATSSRRSPAKTACRRGRGAHPLVALPRS